MKTYPLLCAGFTSLADYDFAGEQGRLMLRALCAVNPPEPETPGATRLLVIVLRLLVDDIVEIDGISMNDAQRALESLRAEIFFVFERMRSHNYYSRQGNTEQCLVSLMPCAFSSAACAMETRLTLSPTALFSLLKEPSHSFAGTCSAS